MKILLGEIMYQKNLTIRQVSRLTGLPKSAISDIVSGRTSPRMETMERLAAGLKIHIADLYESDYK
ncbi:helix-turn-helix domain-containing protein [Bariatricus sp. SGI.161]|uniref:helix-turn-helix domain-containing protein n=1 Tax=Bariatricus sp. SGI.161 TaxID=3420550 RepID=UPI003D0425CC